MQIGRKVRRERGLEREGGACGVCNGGSYCRKRQANFETMSERTDKPIAFLFLAKCPVVCRTIGAEPKTIQVILNTLPVSSFGNNWNNL